MTKRQAFVKLYAEKLVGNVASQWVGREHELAEKMTDGLIAEQASNKGPALIATCRELKIKTTYKALRTYLLTE